VTPAASGPALSIVLPCFNEGARIAASLATLESWFADAEILVMDDGSADDTAAHADAYAARGSRCRVIRLPHRGKGAALRAAIPAVRGERVVFLDADLAFDRQSVERAVEALDRDVFAIGNRRHRDSRYLVPVRLFGFLYSRHVAGQLFNAFVRGVTQLPMRDTQCGLKAFRREFLTSLAPVLTVDGFALDVEILVAAAARGVGPTEVPVLVTYDSAQSGVRLVASGWAMARSIARIVARRMRGRYRLQT
jgi:glycosyltransferase involved in cell wall biosynthesis